MQKALDYLGANTSSPILLVDDDGGAGYQSYYTNALSELGYSNVSVYTVSSAYADGPPLSQMQGKTVIWFTGLRYTYTLRANDQNNLSQFLDGGGRLFITAQDIGYDLVARNNGKTFYANYLHAKYVVDDTNVTTMEGEAGSVFEGLTFNIAGGTGASNQSWPSAIELINPAVLAVQYKSDSARVGSYSGTSMASPHVAGVTALVMADNPSLSWEQTKDCILNSVEPLPPPSQDSSYRRQAQCLSGPPLRSFLHLFHFTFQ